MKEIDKLRLSSEPAYKRLKEMGKASCPSRKTIAQSIKELEEARKEQGPYVTMYVETVAESGKTNIIPLRGPKELIEKLLKKNGPEIIENMVIQNSLDLKDSKKKNSVTTEQTLLK